MPSQRRVNRRAQPGERIFVIALAVFLMLCGTVLVALPGSDTPPEETSCVDADEVRRALGALDEAKIASEKNDLARSQSKLQSARQALTDALAL